MKKVIHVFAYLDRGGAETFAINLLKNKSADLQMDFLVHTDKKMDYENEVTKYGSKIFRLEKYRFYNHLSYVKYLKKILIQNKYDVVHFHLRSIASIMIPTFKKFGVKVIVHSHSTSNGKGICTSFIKNILQYPLRFQADLKVGCTSDSVKWLFGTGTFNNNNYVILPNAVDLELFNKGSIGDDLEYINNKFVVGHVGRFEEVKNHRFIVEVFSEFLKRNPHALLVLVGDGPLKKEIEELVSELSIENCVLFLGKREDIAYVIKKFNILLFPSLYEGLPVSLVEAQAAGIPVLMSDTVSKDVKLTSLVESFSLNKKSSEWSEVMNQVSQRELSSFEKEELFSSDYNVKNLSKYYTKLIDELIESSKR